MKKRKTFIAMGIFIAMLVLGVGYAAVNNLELKLNGTANVTANAEFRVEFDTNHNVVLTPVAGTTVTNPAGDDVDVVSGSYTNGSTAIMTVNLDANTRTASAVYKIVNYSPDLKANLTAEVTADFNDSDDYLTVTKELYKDEECVTVLGSDPLVSDDGTAYLKVTVSLDKLPVEDLTDKTFTITVTATPVDSEAV